jgi:hypothetical protein
LKKMHEGPVCGGVLWDPAISKVPLVCHCSELDRQAHNKLAFGYAGTQHAVYSAGRQTDRNIADHENILISSRAAPSREQIPAELLAASSTSKQSLLL